MNGATFWNLNDSRITGTDGGSYYKVYNSDISAHSPYIEFPYTSALYGKKLYLSISETLADNASTDVYSVDVDYSLAAYKSSAFVKYIAPFWDNESHITNVELNITESYNKIRLNIDLWAKNIVKIYSIYVR